MIYALILTVGALLGVSDERAEAAKIAEQMGGKAEVVLWDRTRCDIVTDTHAWEVEWANKKWEAPSQAVWYAWNLGKKPGVILLTRDRKRDAPDIYRCLVICALQHIDVKIVEVKGDGGG